MARKHSNKHIREAIEYAEERGWTFLKSSARAHAYGRLLCGPGCCQFSVYGTPRNPEGHAEYIRRRVDSCPALNDQHEGEQT